tara:strand:+ start:1969 stop:3426 length:1458 start_codon:yes stop_codon:yes gene_type:complete
MKSCGTCSVWGGNFHTRIDPDVRPWGCCADALMDLPDAFDGNRQMQASDGRDCPIWAPTTPTNRVGIGSKDDAMNAETKVTGTDLVSAVESDPGLALVNRDAFEAWLIDLRARVDGLDQDMTRAKNRDAIRSAAADTRKEKAKYDRSRLELTKGYREMTAKVNEAGKDIDAKLEALAVQIRAPLTEWEEREKARVDRCKTIIAEIHGAAIVTLDDTSETVRERGMRIWTIEIGDDFGDQAGEAEQAKSATVSTLQSALARLKREEADAAELAELRKIQAERDAEDEKRRAAEKAIEDRRDYARRVIEHIRQCGLGMIDGKTYPYIILIRELEEKIVVAEEDFGDMAGDVERARVETLAHVKAAQKEQAERAIREAAEEAAQKAQRDAERAAQIERDRIQAEHDAALAAEKKRADELAAAEAKRIADKAREDAEIAKRERNRAHRAKVMGEAKIAIMAAGAINEEVAVAIVKAIDKGQIPHVSLEF